MQAVEGIRKNKMSNTKYEFVIDHSFDYITEIKKLIKAVYDKCSLTLKDIVPKKLIEDHKLLDYETAIYNVHFPNNQQLLNNKR